MSAPQLKFNFTKRYVIAVLLIATLSSGAIYYLHLALKESESTALIVNMSTKQSMLSQRIRALSQEYYANLYIHPNTENAEQTKIKLILAVVEMEQASEKLSSGRLNPSMQVPLSNEIQEYYQGDKKVKERIKTYLTLARECTHTTQKNELLQSIKRIEKSSESLLPDLNDVAGQYKKEGDEKIAVIHQRQLMLWIMTIITLLLEVIFIFQPMVGKIHELFQEIVWNEAHLKQQIAVRTLNLERTNTKLMQLASHDPLTGLKNRLNMERDLEELILQYQKNHLPYAVLMLDIDWFKKINDNYGHDTGDYILSEFAKIMLQKVRVQDAVYRAGGEEFIIIFNRMTQEQAIEKAEDIRATIEESLFVFDNQEIRFTISGGLYHPETLAASNIQGVLKLADNALYEAKRSGRNQIIQAKFDTIDLSAPLFHSKTRIKFYPLGWERVEFIDHDITDILGYPYEELANGSVGIRDIIHPDDHDVLTRVNEQKHFTTTLRLVDKDENIKIVRAEFTPLDADTWSIDIQDATLLFEKVDDRIIVRNFEAMMIKSDDFIYFKDANHVFTAASETLVNIANVTSKEEFVGKIDYDVFPRDLADQYFILEKEIFKGNLEVSHAIQPFSDKDGSNGWVDNRKYPIKNGTGKIIGLFGVARILRKAYS